MNGFHNASRSLSGLLLAGTVLFHVNFLPAQAPSAGSGQAIPIAVMDFDGFGISQVEAIALTNRLRNELFRLGTFDVVDRGMMENILNEQNFQMVGCTSNECLVEVGRLLGAKQMMGGSISKVGNTFSVSARLVDVETGRLLAVSDYDLRAEIDDMLTTGMRIVALMLSGDEEGAQAVIAQQAPTAIPQGAPQVARGQLALRQQQRPRTWSINAGFGTSRNANLLEITKDVIVGRNLSLFVSAGLGLQFPAGGITYQRHYNEKGLVLSTSVGTLFFEDVIANALIAYQWPLGQRGFLVTGAGLIIFLDYGDAIPYPVLSYEFRF